MINKSFCFGLLVGVLIIVSSHFIVTTLKKEEMKYVPTKPYTIIDKVAGADNTEYTIICVDSVGVQFDFEVEFFNEDKYRVGNIIK